MYKPRVPLTLGICVLFCAECLGQTTAPRDPAALSVAAKALQALIGGTTVSDITLGASAAYTAGSDQEAGPATLLALGNQQSRMTLALTNGTRTEIRSGPSGDWIGIDGVEHAMATHNCWSDAAWFYPGLSLEALNTDPGLGLSYIGPVTHNGVATIDLRLFRVVPSASGGPDPTVLALSTEDLYLNATSLLPLFLDFNVHPDTDLNRNVPVEIVFGGYQSMNGIAVPTSIQEYLNGSLLFSLTVGPAAINSGLPASDFAVTASTGGAE